MSAISSIIAIIKRLPRLPVVQRWTYSLEVTKSFSGHFSSRSGRKANDIWSQRIPTVLSYRELANRGNIALLQSYSCIRPHAHSNLLKRNTRNRHKEPWMMSDEEVMDIITENECSGKLQHGIVSKFESNLLPSNNPTEDRRFVTKLKQDRGAFLFGVLDGHGGSSCAHNVSQRLSDYIGLSLLPNEILLGPNLKNFLCSEHFIQPNSPNNYNYREDPVCYKSLKAYYLELCRIQKRHDVSGTMAPTFLHLQETHGHKTAIVDAKEEQVSQTMGALSKAFLRLDEDLSCEAVIEGDNKEAHEHRLKAATSGACALVVYVKGTELTVANCGDCRAVLGVKSEDGQWSALQLSTDHTSRNPREVQRVLNEHPADEASTVLRYERLLGRLAPLRAFGDVMFKWSKTKQEEVFNPKGDKSFADMAEFLTPPYLAAEPEVMSYQLQRTDKFLILATDGLWDMLSNEEAVEFVRDHLEKQNSDPETPDQEPSSNLKNSASCLIKEALGGEDHLSVSMSLSLPYPDVRSYRDDITVTVVHFDWSNVVTE